MAHLRFDLERDQLAAKLGGALPRNAVCVIAGEGGAGKSLLSQRIAYGALRHGARTAYVSTELGLLGFLEQMHSLGYDVEMDALERRLAFYSTMVDGEEPVPKTMRMLRLLTSDVREGRDLLVIDCLSTLLRDGQPLFVGRGSLLEMTLERLQTWARGGLAIVVTVDPLEIARDDVGALERIADVYLDVRKEMTGTEAVHLAHVRRFARPLSRVADVIGFRVEPSAGLILEIKGVYG